MRTPLGIHLMLIVTAMWSATSRSTGRHFVQAAFQSRANVRRYGSQRPRLSRFSSTDSTEESSPKGTTAASDDPLEVYRNPKNRNDQVFSAISADGGIKVTACSVRNLVNDMMIQHAMTEVPTEVSWTTQLFSRDEDRCYVDFCLLTGSCFASMRRLWVAPLSVAS